MAEDEDTEISASFIDSATTVHTRVLSNDVMRDFVRRLDDKYGHGGPLDSIERLQALVSKSRTHDR